MRNTRTRAAKRGLEFNLELTDIEIPTHCPVLDLKLDFNVHHSEPNYPTVDRVDNRFGYIKGNVRIISWRANWLKGDATLDELKRIVHYMEDRHFHCPNGCEKVVFIPQEKGLPKCIECGTEWVSCTPATC